MGEERHRGESRRRGRHRRGGNGRARDTRRLHALPHLERGRGRALSPREVAFDPFRDFAALVQVAQVPNVFLVGKGLGVTTLKDFTAMARASPGKIRYASSGKGTPSQLTVELYKSMAGVNIEEIPYK